VAAAPHRPSARVLQSDGSALTFPPFCRRVDDRLSTQQGVTDRVRRRSVSRHRGDRREQPRLFNGWSGHIGQANIADAELLA